MKYHRPPFSLNEIKLEVTHDCLLRCVHCSSMAQAGCGREMDWHTCRQILSDAAAMGVTEVAFSGGEPLLWKHLVDAVGTASKLGMKVFVYTTGNTRNGTELFDDLKAAGLSRVMFSVFSSDMQQHDAVTTITGSHEITMQTVRHCAKLGVETEFHFVPMKQNFVELRMITLQARALGVKQVSVLRLVPQGRGAQGEDMQLSMEQNKTLRRTILDLRAEGHDIRLGSPYNFLMLRDDPKCCAGIDRLTIGPDLRIFPCDAFKHISPEEIGARDEYSNLNDHSLAECWEKSSYLGIVREYLTTDFAEHCSKCGSLEDCLSGCMAQKFHVHGNMLKRPDPMCLMN